MRFEWQHTTSAVQIKEDPLDNLVKALMIVNNFVIDAQLAVVNFTCLSMVSFNSHYSETDEKGGK